MNIFISWSGSRSRIVAEYLSEWLRKLPLQISPWVSGDAIDPGTRWERQLTEALESMSFGVLCLTKENQLEPWICFEGGSLSKIVDKAHVIPYLIDMKPSELKHPLKQFQAIEANKNDTWKLVRSIYKATGDKTRSEKDLEEVYEVWWDRLNEKIESVRKVDVSNVQTPEPSMYEIKGILEQVSSVIESLSSRFIKWESVQGYQHVARVVENPTIKDCARLSDPNLNENIQERLLDELPRKLAKTRIITDVRPVFGNDQKITPSKAIIIHTLILYYIEQLELREFHVSFDNNILNQLKSALTRALSKEQSIKDLLNQITVTADVGQEGQE